MYKQNKTNYHAKEGNFLEAISAIIDINEINDIERAIEDGNFSVLERLNEIQKDCYQNLDEERIQELNSYITIDNIVSSLQNPDKYVNFALLTIAYYYQCNGSSASERNIQILVDFIKNLSDESQDKTFYLGILAIESMLTPDQMRTLDQDVYNAILGLYGLSPMKDNAIALYIISILHVSDEVTEFDSISPACIEFIFQLLSRPTLACPVHLAYIIVFLHRREIFDFTKKDHQELLLKVFRMDSTSYPVFFKYFISIDSIPEFFLKSSGFIPQIFDVISNLDNPTPIIVSVFSFVNMILDKDPQYYSQSFISEDPINSIQPYLIDHLINNVHEVKIPCCIHFSNILRRIPMLFDNIFLWDPNETESSNINLLSALDICISLVEDSPYEGFFVSLSSFLHYIQKKNTFSSFLEAFQCIDLKDRLMAIKSENVEIGVLVESILEQFFN